MPAMFTLRAPALVIVLLASSSAFPRADGPAPDRATAQYEIRFMTGMIDHHAMAVHMAHQCHMNAVTPVLIDTCMNMMMAQQEEIATMQAWLQEWYGISYVPQMTTGMHQQMHRLAQLSGPEFEIAFMKSMIRHHWTAVVQSAGCIDRAAHEELVEMCGAIIEMQVAEIRQMRSWLCEWYGVCNYGPKGAVGDTP